MGIELTMLHGVYLLFIFIIIGIMIMRRDTTLICVIGIFLLGLIASSSLNIAVSGIFNSFIFAIRELLGTILIISIIVAMSRILIRLGINEVMISPFTKMIRTPALAYWTIGILMMVISWFFWPSPAVALLGAVLLPVALRVGLPALGVAMAMNLFGHGIALSGDYIIQGAPKLTADAAGIPVGEVMAASVPLVIIMGAVTTVVAFWMLKRDMRKGKLSVSEEELVLHQEDEKHEVLSYQTKKLLSVLIPILLLIDVVVMFTLGLQGGDATALIGGTVIFILILIAMLGYRNQGMEKITSYMIEGFQFGFKVFGPVIPIAAFFYMGDAGFTSVFGELLPEGSQGIVNDLGYALAQSVPVHDSIAAITLTIVGSITGLDGSGFSGISLVGSIASLFAVAIGKGIATLTALGQISAIWVGGGTLVPWALIPAAAICNVSPFELARRNLFPVIIGLFVTTIAAMLILSI
ncbi:hypothetical protein [Pseudalkalibacillus salsuginis]|uniref:hypothetical protein n=1 Tax=Pseudalkalibacillus salsuginis TaxID=2910972 RepID=UPI001F237F43|nr:hypothetical protein [Pseudalkalibacillus salsuginis]MCF6411772.1 hypothetical protein [Pseudalkalibacillus salsuginis]